MTKYIWRLIPFIIGCIIIYLLLQWIGFDMHNFQNLWNTMISCIKDILHATRHMLE